jgi:ribonuclease HI
MRLCFPVISKEKNDFFLVYVDGASSGNPGPGGWGAIVLTDEKQIIELGGHAPHVTNNQMELLAAREALSCIERERGMGFSVQIHSDSQYLVLGMTTWTLSWKKKGWLTSQGTPVANQDLWQDLLLLASRFRISWNHVRAHCGIVGNERADQIAVSFSKKQKLPLYCGPWSGYRFQSLAQMKLDPRSR